MSGGKRRGPVGPGYMPKGGVAAARAHNARAVPPSRPAATPPHVVPVTADGRTDVRASARSAGRWTERAAVVGVAVAASAGTVGVLRAVEWLVR